MKKKATHEERVAAYQADEAALLKKYRFKKRIIITFRHLNKPPLLARFAVWILGKYKASTEILLIENKPHG